MADAQISASAVTAAPLDYTVPGAQEILIRACRATYDGTGAAGPYIPTLTLLSPSGKIVWQAPISNAVAAGASADVSWFSGVGGNTTIVNNTTPGAVLDYAEPPAGTLNITATTAATAQSWIVGNPVTLDGVTRVRIECFIALATTNHDVVAELYDNGADVSRLIQIGYTPVGALNALAISTFGAAHIIPSAGSHQFEIRAWQDVGATSSFLNPTPFPFVLFAPSYYQVVIAPEIA